MSDAPGPIMVAGVAQKMANILAFSCPPNYVCAGPAYAAQSALEDILHILGVGITIIQRGAKISNMEEFQKEIWENTVCGESMMQSFIQHKSQILASALHSVLYSSREKEFRECGDVTEEALLMLMQYYFTRSGVSKEDFWKKLMVNNHDELEQLEKEIP